MRNIFTERSSRIFLEGVAAEISYRIFLPQLYQTSYYRKHLDGVGCSVVFQERRAHLPLLRRDLLRSLHEAQLLEARHHRVQTEAADEGGLRVRLAVVAFRPPARLFGRRPRGHEGKT